MEIFLYRQGAEHIEEGFTVEQLPDLLKNEGDVIWVDMEQPTEADEQVLLDIFNFHPLTVEDCRENRHYPKIEEFPGYLYFIVHGVRADTSPDHFNTIEQLIRTSPIACKRGAPFLLYQILDQIVDYYSPVLDDFDERIDKLEDDIFTLKSPNNEILAEIMDLKRGVLRLRRISSKQMEILYR